MHWSCKPHDSSQLQCGGGPRAAHEPPKKHAREAIGLCASARSWWAGPPCGSDIWLIPLPSPNLRCRPSDVRQSGLLRCVFARFGSISTGIRFRHKPSDLQSPDARGLVIKSPPSTPADSPPVSLQHKRSLLDGRGCSLGGSLHASAPLMLSTLNQELVTAKDPGRVRGCPGQHPAETASSAESSVHIYSLHRALLTFSSRQILLPKSSWEQGGQNLEVVMSRGPIPR